MLIFKLKKMATKKVKEAKKVVEKKVVEKKVSNDAKYPGNATRAFRS